MRKGLRKEDVLTWVKTCVAGGVKNFHLYFMVWIESETEEDRRDIARMVREISEVTWGDGELYLKINLHIPSAQTVWQRMRMYSVVDYRKFIAEINSEIEVIFTEEERKRIHVITLDDSRLILESILMRWWVESQKILEDIIAHERIWWIIDEKSIEVICARHSFPYAQFLANLDVNAPLPWQDFSSEELLKKDRHFISQVQNT